MGRMLAGRGEGNSGQPNILRISTRWGDRKLMTNPGAREPHSTSSEFDYRMSKQTPGHSAGRQRFKDLDYPTPPIEIDEIDGIPHANCVHRFAGYDP
jgi:hypothetical protein